MISGSKTITHTKYSNDKEVSIVGKKEVLGAILFENFSTFSLSMSHFCSQNLNHVSFQEQRLNAGSIVV
jgi:hypothetical protein